MGNCHVESEEINPIFALFYHYSSIESFSSIIF